MGGLDFGGRIRGEILEFGWDFWLWGRTGSERGVGDFEFGGMVSIRGRILRVCVMVCFLCLCWEAQGVCGNKF